MKLFARVAEARRVTHDTAGCSQESGRVPYPATLLLSHILQGLQMTWCRIFTVLVVFSPPQDSSRLICGTLQSTVLVLDLKDLRVTSIFGYSACNCCSQLLCCRAGVGKF